MKFGELIIWTAIGLFIIWFFNSSSVIQILIGFIILLLLLVRDSVKKKSKNTFLERASHETFYDLMKWTAFGIFVIIYPVFLKSNTTALLVTIFIFLLVLFGLNILMERNSPKQGSIY